MEDHSEFEEYLTKQELKELDNAIAKSNSLKTACAFISFDKKVCLSPMSMDSAIIAAINAHDNRGIVDIRKEKR